MAAELIDRKPLLDRIQSNIRETVKRKMTMPKENPLYSRLQEKLVQLRRFEKMLVEAPEQATE